MNLKDKFSISYSRIACILILTGIFALLYVLNHLYPLHPDDWQYSFVYGNGRPVKSFYDIFESQYNHYFYWGGRVVLHFIAQVLLMIERVYSDIINSVAFTALVYLMYRYTNRTSKSKPLLLLAYFFMLWFFIPSFPCSVLWITGSANYLWSVLILLLFFFPFYKYMLGEEIKNSRFRNIIVPLIGIIVGLLNENSSAAMILAVILIIGLLKYEKRDIPLWMRTSVLGLIIGYLALMLAPGNTHRFYLQNGTLEDLNLLDQTVIIERLTNAFHISINSYLLVLSIAFIFLFIIFIKMKTTDSAKKKQTINSVIILGLTAYASAFIMLLSPTFPDRTLFFTSALIILAMGNMLTNMEVNRIVKNIAIAGFMCISLSLFSLDYFWKYETLENAFYFWKERDEFVQQQKALGIEDIVFTKNLRAHSKYCISHELEFTSGIENWTNRRYAKY